LTSSDRTQALHQRLRAAAQVLLGDEHGRDALDTGQLLDALVHTVRRSLRPPDVWLLMTAIAGSYPEPDRLQAALRALELADDTESALYLLHDLRPFAVGNFSRSTTLEILRDQVIVETDFSAQQNLHTGIQRVVRTTLPLWETDRHFVPVVWTNRHAAMRRLTTLESARLMKWAGASAHPAVHRTMDDHIIVPWSSVIVLAEVPHQASCSALTCIARFSGNRVVAIGYDCIPIVSADLVPLAEPNRFVHYLEVLKYSRRVAGISISATDEFAGFANMLPAQGLVGPTVIECALPDDMPWASSEAPTPGEPTVLCVGSIEPRKNQAAVIFAAQQLWDEGLRFRLRFVGGGARGLVPELVSRLRRRGRRVTIETAISDAELARAYQTARFTIFVSVHEGYGLPVAESLAFGVPAMATCYGSTGEIGAGGGVELVDPRDDAQIVATMRRLLIDDSHLAALRSQIAKRPKRSWSDYARQLWRDLVEPEMQANVR
jgi:glycosyltransferase involved in cell wall biosynthesis